MTAFEITRIIRIYSREKKLRNKSQENNVNSFVCLKLRISFRLVNIGNDIPTVFRTSSRTFFEIAASIVCDEDLRHLIYVVLRTHKYSFAPNNIKSRQLYAKTVHRSLTIYLFLRTNTWRRFSIKGSSYVRSISSCYENVNLWKEREKIYRG